VGHRALVLIAAATMLVASGCGSSATPSPSTLTAADTPEPALASVAPSLIASPSPVPSAAGGEAFPVGLIPAGTWTATQFTPAYSLTLPDGWSRGTADREVTVLEKGDVTVGIHRRISAVDAAALGDGATATTIGAYPAFTLAHGPSHLWYTDGQIEFWAPPGTRVQSWVIGLGDTPVTVDLVAPEASFDAALADFEPILATIQAPD